MNHSKGREKKTAEDLEKVGDERPERENERLFEYLEESERKEAKSGESEQGKTCSIVERRSRS